MGLLLTVAAGPWRPIVVGVSKEKAWLNNSSRGTSLTVMARIQEKAEFCTMTWAQREMTALRGPRTDRKASVSTTALPQSNTSSSVCGAERLRNAWRRTTRRSTSLRRSLCSAQTCEKAPPSRRSSPRHCVTCSSSISGGMDPACSSTFCVTQYTFLQFKCLGRVLFEKLAVAQPVKKCPVMGTVGSLRCFHQLACPY